METKKCSICKEILSITKFSRDKSKKDGLQYSCKECQYKYKLSRNFKPNENPEREKFCSKCNTYKPATLEYFHSNRKNSDGMCYMCKQCSSERTILWNNKNREKCFVCKVIKPVCYRTKNNEPICSNCRKKMRSEVCFGCGKTKPVESRTSEGKPLCSNCHIKNNLKPCSMCKKMSIINKKLMNGSFLCSRCRKRSEPRLWFNVYKRGAKKREILFDIDFNLFVEITNSRCYYCNSSPKENGLLGGIDRLNSSIGYIKENIVPCCSQCNAMKKDLSKEQFINSIIKIFNNFKHPI